MTPPQSFFMRPQGGGWLILCGGSADDAIAARAAALVQQAGQLVVLAPSARAREAAEARLAECSAVCGLPGEIELLDSPRGEECLSEATMIVIPDTGSAAELAKMFEESGFGESLLLALEDGALVLAEGRSSEALGEVIEAEELSPGCGWLRRALIQSHHEAGMACLALRKRPTLYRLGLGEHAALALGPQGQVEVWGEPAPTVTLGAAWTR
jgi:hypothetical protein